MNKNRRCNFSHRLLCYISSGIADDDDKAIAMLNRRLAQARDDTETLLHFAVRWNNYTVAQELLDLGADVDSKGEGGTTPLMEAVQTLLHECVEVLLEANANIDIVDDDGQSALQMALDHEYCDDLVIKEFMTQRLKTETTTTEELANRLIKGRCNMHHTIALKDIELMECMLKLGVDVDSKNAEGKTALHAAAKLGELDLAKWLIGHGANVNALDKQDVSPLLLAAEHGSKDMVKFLLEQGADPNCKDQEDDKTPLYEAIQGGRDSERFFECAKLLLHYGAIPQNSAKSNHTIFDWASFWSSDELVKMLISHVAMLEKLKMIDPESVMIWNYETNQPKIPKLKSFYECCVKVLKIVVFGKLTLFDLLQVNGLRMRFMVRDENFISKVEKACSEHKLSELFSCYYNILMENINKARLVVKLEDEAIPVINKIFNCHSELRYNFIKKIVSYLNERDLQGLIQV